MSVKDADVYGAWLKHAFLIDLRRRLDMQASSRYRPIARDRRGLLLGRVAAAGRQSSLYERIWNSGPLFRGITSYLEYRIPRRQRFKRFGRRTRGDGKVSLYRELVTIKIGF
jgi:hypothetical protein